MHCCFLKGKRIFMRRLLKITTIKRRKPKIQRRVGKKVKTNMKKTISKNIWCLVLVAGIALVITSCRKEQNADFKLNELQVKTNTGDAVEIPVVSPCSNPIPDSLQPPAGNRLLLQTYARGVQIYQVKRSATDPTVFLWVNIAPSATLYARPDFTNEVAIHYAGPTWEFTKGPYKGTKVVATKLRSSIQDVTAIPWLLLKAVDSLSSPGNKVTYIQRLCTAGGLAPAKPADEAHLGQLDSIPYTASYIFYASKN
jgi:hypothetical protein